MPGKAKRRQLRPPTGRSTNSRQRRARVSLSVRSIDRLLVDGTRSDFERVLDLPGGAQAVLKGVGRKLERERQRVKRMKRIVGRLEMEIERL